MLSFVTTASLKAVFGICLLGTSMFNLWMVKHNIQTLLGSSLLSGLSGVSLHSPGPQSMPRGPILLPGPVNTSAVVATPSKAPTVIQEATTIPWSYHDVEFPDFSDYAAKFEYFFYVSVF